MEDREIPEVRWRFLRYSLTPDLSDHPFRNNIFVAAEVAPKRNEDFNHMIG